MVKKTAAVVYFTSDIQFLSFCYTNFIIADDKDELRNIIFIAQLFKYHKRHLFFFIYALNYSIHRMIHN